MTNTNGVPDIRQQLVDRYAIERELGRGFLRETRTAASFSHPNIVPVHAVEDRDGVLAYAHGRGVVHRDIKPDNIMLERATGRALLMDFGISRSITAKVEQKGATQGLTRVGEVAGTAEYMSPEQASGDVVDGRSDLYSLGLVALFALTGRPAISGESTQQILVKQLTETPPAAVSLRPDLPESLLPVAILLINLSLNIDFSLGTKAQVVQTESSQLPRARARRATATAPSTDRVRSLEERVAALERWRDRSEPIA
jgi:serine/threonine protein kinase